MDGSMEETYMYRSRMLLGMLLVAFGGVTAHAFDTCEMAYKICNNTGQKLKLQSVGWKYKDTGDWKTVGFGTAVNQLSAGDCRSWPDDDGDRIHNCHWRDIRVSVTAKCYDRDFFTYYSQRYEAHGPKFYVEIDMKKCPGDTGNIVDFTFSD